MVSLNRTVGIIPARPGLNTLLTVQRMSGLHRRYAAGAEVQPDGSTHFRVWAPEPRQIALRIERPNDKPYDIGLEREADGYYSALVADATAGTRYRYVLDGDALPDP